MLLFIVYQVLITCQTWFHYIPFQSSQWSYETGTIIIPVLQMRSAETQWDKWLVQGSVAIKWQNQDDSRICGLND